MRRLIILLAITGLLALPVSALAADPTPTDTPVPPVTVSAPLPTLDPKDLTPEFCAQLLGISLPADSSTSGTGSDSGTTGPTPPTPTATPLGTPLPTEASGGSDLLIPIPALNGPVPSFDANLDTQCRALLGLSGDGLAPAPAPASSPEATSGTLSLGFCGQILGASTLNINGPTGYGSAASGSATISTNGVTESSGGFASGGGQGGLMTNGPQPGNAPGAGINGTTSQSTQGLTIQSGGPGNPTATGPASAATTAADLAIVAQCQALLARTGLVIGQTSPNVNGIGMMGQAANPAAGAPNQGNNSAPLFRRQRGLGYGGMMSGSFGRAPEVRGSGSSAGVIPGCPVGRPWWAYFWLAVALAGCFGAGYLLARARRLRRTAQATTPPSTPAAPTSPEAGSGI